MPDPATNIVHALHTLDAATRAQLAEGLASMSDPMLRAVGDAMDAVGPKIAALVIGAALHDAALAGSLSATAHRLPDDGLWGEVRTAMLDYAAHPDHVDIAPDE